MRARAPRKKRPAKSATPSAEQLVLPFTLRPGDVVLEDGAQLEVVSRPTGTVGGKMTRAWVRDGGAQREVVWEAWRRLKVRRSA